MKKASVLLDPADLRALRKATGKASPAEALAALVNRLTPSDGPTAKPAKKRAANKPARAPAKKAKAKPAAKKPAKKGKGAKKPLSKAAFLARMAAGRAKAAKAKKRSK